MTNTIKLGTWSSIDAKRNRFRYYHLYLTEDLWGETCLVKAWGRIGKGPQQRFYWLAEDKKLGALLQAVILRRLSHGYRQN